MIWPREEIFKYLHFGSDYHIAPLPSQRKILTFFSFQATLPTQTRGRTSSQTDLLGTGHSGWCGVWRTPGTARESHSRNYPMSFKAWSAARECSESSRWCDSFSMRTCCPASTYYRWDENQEEHWQGRDVTQYVTWGESGGCWLGYRLCPSNWLFPSHTINTETSPTLPISL